MRYISILSFRLFFAFLAAKFLARSLDLESLGPLMGLTCLVLGNIYFFDYLDYQSRTSWRRRLTRPPETATPGLSSAPEPPPKT